MANRAATSKRRQLFFIAVTLVAALSLAGVSSLAAQEVQGADPAGYFAVGANANRVQNEKPVQQETIAVLDALPAVAPAVPKKPRRVFVFCRAVGFVHSSIPLAAFTIQAMGEKTGAWTTTISYSLADFTAANLAQYDAIVLDSTTGAFLDDSDAAATAARHQALLSFVNGGKGLVMIHAAADSYHTNGTSPAPGAHRSHALLPFSDAPTSTWPAYSAMVGGFFKWHWPYPQFIHVHLDDPRNPILAGYHSRDFTIHDETYTFAGFSAKNVHVLTSIDYAKMSPTDKAKENYKRPDHFYALSWIHRVGKGRVFYVAHGHDEHVYANTAYLEELLAGTQYALGDLKADDRPGVK